MNDIGKNGRQAGEHSYTIIGNSAAAIGAVEGIRENDPRGPITIYTDEPYPAYSRPMITDLVADTAVLENGKIFIRDVDFYSRLGVKLVKSEVTGVDHKKKVLEADNKAVPFDKLLIATGGRPVVPDVK